MDGEQVDTVLRHVLVPVGSTDTYILVHHDTQKETYVCNGHILPCADPCVYPLTASSKVMATLLSVWPGRGEGPQS